MSRSVGFVPCPRGISIPLYGEWVAVKPDSGYPKTWRKGKEVAVRGFAAIFPDDTESGILRRELVGFD